MLEQNALFSTAAMAAVFAPEAHVQRMLDVEAALARAEAACGIIPAAAAAAIGAACQVERFDLAALYREAALAGTLAIPLVRVLTAALGDEAGQYVHWGATSQDVIDTALMLQMGEGLALLDADLLGVCAACAALAEQHRHTIMAGRTLLQQALPITFGLKAARWLALVVRQVQALRRCRAESLVLQFGGAAGTLAVFGDDGLMLAERFARELMLPLPELPWHAERDRVAALASALGVMVGAMAKIAEDIVLLAQTEVGEVAEAAAPGKGASSAMPHKHNPVDATMALASARLALGAVPTLLAAMANEHERAVGGWQAEWAALPTLFCHSASALARLRSALEGLQVDAQRMRANLDRGGGLLMAEAMLVALARQLGRPTAQRLLQQSLRRVHSEGVSFRQALHENDQIRAVLSPETIDSALNPTLYLGSSEQWIDRALAGYRALEQEAGA